MYRTYIVGFTEKCTHAKMPVVKLSTVKQEHWKPGINLLLDIYVGDSAHATWRTIQNSRVCAVKNAPCGIELTEGKSATIMQWHFQSLFGNKSPTRKFIKYLFTDLLLTHLLTSSQTSVSCKSPNIIQINALQIKSRYAEIRTFGEIITLKDILWCRTISELPLFIHCCLVDY